MQRHKHEQNNQFGRIQFTTDDVPIRIWQEMDVRLSVPQNAYFKALGVYVCVSVRESLCVF